MVSVTTFTTQPIMSLKEILQEHFYDCERPLALLKKHNLEELFENSVQVIRIEIQKEPIDFAKFRVIASNVLVAVNTKLRDINDSYEKGYLENIAREVAVHLLSKISMSAGNAARLMGEIKSGLETTSSLNGYNFEALIALLKLNNESSRVTGSRLNGPFYYEWKGSPNDLDDLVQNLKSAGWISSVKQFRKLFTNHRGETLQIPFNPERLHDVLALFDVLKAKKLITPKGSKGHFHSLRCYLVDFENKVLIKEDPKTIKMIAKRDTENWEKLIINATRKVAGYKVAQPAKLPSSR